MKPNHKDVTLGHGFWVFCISQQLPLSLGKCWLTEHSVIKYCKYYLLLRNHIKIKTKNVFVFLFFFSKWSSVIVAVSLTSVWHRDCVSVCVCLTQGWYTKNPESQMMEGTHQWTALRLKRITCPATHTSIYLFICKSVSALGDGRN